MAVIYFLPMKLNITNKLVLSLIAATMLAACGGGDGGTRTTTSASYSNLVSPSTSQNTNSNMSLTLPKVQAQSQGSSATVALNEGIAKSRLTPLSLVNSWEKINETNLSLASKNHENGQLTNPSLFRAANSTDSFSQEVKTHVLYKETSGNNIYTNAVRTSVIGFNYLLDNKKRLEPYLSNIGGSSTTPKRPDLLGKDVKVGVIDSPWQDGNYWSGRLTNVIKVSQNSTDYTAPNGDENSHGMMVSTIIADKDLGIARNATIVYRNSNSYFDDDLKSLLTQKPRVVNLSLGFDPWFQGINHEAQIIAYTSSHGASYQDLDKEYYLNQVRDNLGKLKRFFNTTRGNYSPLVVQAAGNTFHLEDWVANHYSNNISRSDVTYGQFVESFSHEAQAATSDSVSPFWLLVTGAYYDPTDRYRLELEYIKDNILTIKQKNLSYSKLAQEAKEFAKQKVENQTVDPKTFYSDTPKDHYYADILTWRCGDAMYSCVAANSDWFFTDPNASSNGKTQKSDGVLSYRGTSLSAPQVTAAGALVVQNFPWMKGPELKTVLTSTATDIGEKGVDRAFGWGLINIPRAIKGPMQFWFKDFDADMTDYSGSTGQNQYYFSNNISGVYGLIVNGKKNDSLYLTGENNTFTGNTIINSGKLVITDQKSIGQNSKANSTVSYKSNIFVNKANGNSPNRSNVSVLETYNAKLNKVTNSDHAQFYNTTATEFVNTAGATVGFVIPKNANSNSSTNNSGSSVALKVTGKASLGNNSSAVIKFGGNLKQNNQGTSSKTAQEYTLLEAKTLEGKISSYTVENALYNVSAVNTDNAKGKVTAKVETLTAARAIARSADSFAQADTQLVEIGTSNIDSVLQQASIFEGQYNQSNSSNDSNSVSYSLRAQPDVADATDATNTIPANTITTANELFANLTKEKLNQLAYVSAGSIYANLQKSVDLQSKQINSNFNSLIANSFDNDGRDNIVHAYVDYNRGSSNWTTNESALKGKLNDNRVTVGAYAQSKLNTASAFNWGAYASVGSSSYQEDLHLTPTVNTSTSTIVASGDVKAFALGFVAGKADKNSSTSLGLNYNHYNYKTLTHYYDNNEANSKFNAWGVNLIANQNFKVYAQDNLQVNLGVEGLVGYYKQNAFKETVNNDNLVALAFNAKSKSSFQLGASLYSQLAYLTKLSNDYAVLWTIGAQLGYYNDAKFVLELEDGKDTYKGFANNFLAQLNAGAKLILNDKFAISLAGNVKKTSSFKQANAKLALDVQF